MKLYSTPLAINSNGQACGVNEIKEVNSIHGNLYLAKGCKLPSVQSVIINHGN